ncbi:hypothetical protein CBR_g30125 [Chara braunii]|uniref:EamA domain-containing protein n=1 Tax=Chara braunii TaxID=69332 RepID=A0A388LC24_CHABU|nr:hypothetical protein CBR_g30125 [Chara braunii]|eukprot:GBG79860.1 hypothetical protein CBR_g30125 [Chara braunii]
MGEWICNRAARFCSTWLPALALGQVLSLLVAGTALVSTLLVDKGIAIPTSQTLATYVLLVIVCGSVFWFKGAVNAADIQWKAYLALALVDLEANYIVIKAYQYTSITSVLLLDCWTIPCVVLGTWLFLGVRYRLRQFFGIFICIMGIAVLVLSDVHADDGTRGPRAVLGDFLVLVGATLYACSNVGEEFLVKANTSKVEMLTFLGVFGSIFGFIQLLVLERQEVASFTFGWDTSLLFLGFACISGLFYLLAPLLFQIGGSAMFNLSLLTSDVWGIVIRSLMFHQRVDALYYVAFGAFAVGLVIYSVNLPKDGPNIKNYHALSTQITSGDSMPAFPSHDMEEGPVTEIAFTPNESVCGTVERKPAAPVGVPEGHQAEQQQQQQQ